MADTAAWLVDDVIPDVPVRQWVLSVPFKVRFVLARDAKLLTKALGIFIREVFRDLRRRTGGKPGDGGAVTGVQRFGGSLNLNVHFHAVVLDGVYREGKFKPAPRPKQPDLEAMVVRVRRKIQGMLRREGVRLDDEDDEITEPLDLFQAASIQRRVATSPDARAVEVVGGEKGVAVQVRKKHLEAEEQGYSIHAAVRMKAGDRKGLEILARYVLRPSFAEERMIRLPDGRIAYRFRRAWEDGSSHVILTPMELMAKLAALVPPPRYHLVRYHGVLAPSSKRRPALVRSRDLECGHAAPVAPESTPTTTPAVAAPEATGHAPPCALDSTPNLSLSPPAMASVTAPSESVQRAKLIAETPVSAVEGPPREQAPPPLPTAPVAPSAPDVPVLSGRSIGPKPVPWPPAVAAPQLSAPISAGPKLLPPPPAPPAAVPLPERRLVRPAHARRPWAALMLRTLMLDVLKCPRCPGRMKVIACIDQPDVIEKFLRSAGLWTEPSPGRGTATLATPFPDDSPWSGEPEFRDEPLNDPPPDPALD
jgi:hypothetical protein